METGNTLRANNLEIQETIVDISARFFSNKSAFKFKTREIEAVLEGLASEISEK